MRQIPQSGDTTGGPDKKDPPVLAGLSRSQVTIADYSGIVPSMPST